MRHTLGTTAVTAGLDGMSSSTVHTEEARLGPLVIGSNVDRGDLFKGVFPPWEESRLDEASGESRSVKWSGDRLASRSLPEGDAPT
jgi:hypothetical protein